MTLACNLQPAATIFPGDNNHEAHHSDGTTCLTHYAVFALAGFTGTDSHNAQSQINRTRAAGFLHSQERRRHMDLLDRPAEPEPLVMAGG